MTEPATAAAEELKIGLSEVAKEENKTEDGQIISSSTANI
jgi:hypothetical protein